MLSLYSKESTDYNIIRSGLLYKIISCFLSKEQFLHGYLTNLNTFYIRQNGEKCLPSPQRYLV